MSDIIKNKPSAARIAFTERVKRFSYGTAAFLVIASTGIVDEEPEPAQGDRTKSHLRYLENQGCDRKEYLRGDVPFCPDETPEEEQQSENMSIELTAP